MKFSERVEEIKNDKENEGKIVLVRCGIFVIAIGNDAILLNELYGLKVTCFKDYVCKVGIPVSFVLKYLDLIEEKGYGYVLYDYGKSTKELVKRYNFEGAKNTETKTCKSCRDCTNYKGGCQYSNINIYEILEQRKGKKEENEY